MHGRVSYDLVYSRCCYGLIQSKTETAWQLPVQVFSDNLKKKTSDRHTHIHHVGIFYFVKNAQDWGSTVRTSLKKKNKIKNK